MKKVFFVLAMVAVFGFATSTASAEVVTLDNAEVELVANDNAEVADNEVKKEAKAKKADAKKADAKSEAKSEGCAAKKESGASCGAK
ncbi:MAG: hypothetical protein JXR61_08990 [Prolixibacteraceae bacterium]|nr:hypothetical protein [Prolixibacteraceae bacterium]